jgi:hypothetical protein
MHQLGARFMSVISTSSISSRALKRPNVVSKLGLAFGRIFVKIELFLPKIDIVLRQFIQSLDRFKALETVRLPGTKLPKAYHLCKFRLSIALRVMLLILRVVITLLILKTGAIVVLGLLSPRTERSCGLSAVVADGTIAPASGSTTVEDGYESSRGAGIASRSE